MDEIFGIPEDRSGMRGEPVEPCPRAWWDEATHLAVPDDLQDFARLDGAVEEVVDICPEL